MPADWRVADDPFAGEVTSRTVIDSPLEVVNLDSDPLRSFTRRWKRYRRGCRGLSHLKNRLAARILHALKIYLQRTATARNAHGITGCSYINPVCNRRL